MVRGGIWGWKGGTYGGGDSFVCIRKKRPSMSNLLSYYRRIIKRETWVW